MTQSPTGVPDIQTLIQNQPDKPPTFTFEDALAGVDPADSEAALAMLDFLLTTGRLHRVGVLDGEQGYLFVYREPQGATKAGYRPGATRGDQIVDQMVEQQRANGAKPTRRGLCPHCMSVVKEDTEGLIVADVEGAGTAAGSCSRSPDGAHGMAS